MAGDAHLDNMDEHIPPDEMYVECGKEHGIDLSTKKQTLKKKLVERFPGLHLLKHNQRNRRELVYFHEKFPTKHLQ